MQYIHTCLMEHIYTILGWIFDILNELKLNIRTYKILLALDLPLSHNWGPRWA